jgi:hypothetical protein
MWNTIIGCECFLNTFGAMCLHIDTRYDMAAIEGSLADQKISDPNDLTFLINHMRQLPDEVRKYLLWAAFFGET